MSDPAQAQHEGRREWQISSPDLVLKFGDFEPRVSFALSVKGFEPERGDFIRAREVRPGEITITREELKEVWRRAVGMGGSMQTIEELLFGPLSEGSERTETEGK